MNKECLVCGKQIKPFRTFCSHKCTIEHRKTMPWNSGYKKNMSAYRKLKVFRDMRLKALSEMKK